MNVEFFLDTNILVYSFNLENSEKQRRAQSLVESALTGGAGTISSQVVQEFLNVALHKFEAPMTIDAAQDYLRIVLRPLCTVFPSIELYVRALELHERWRYRLYDSLIIAAALESGCDILYSEDLQHGQKLESLQIVNPFLPA